jgi:hypothetical protein
MTDDFSVPVWEGPYAEARERMTWLEAAHIPVDLGDALSPGEARIEVPGEYADDARTIMRHGPTEQSWVPLIDPTAPSFSMWKIALVVLVLVAIVLTLVI